RSTEVRGRLLGKRELDEDGGAFLFLILNLGFGERGMSTIRPLDRLLRLVNGAILHELREDAENLRLVSGSHGEIGIGPIAKDPEAAEGAALDVDELFGELGAAAADFRRLQTGRLL